MFLLDGHPISPDVAFVHNGVQYPANWLRLATPEERAEIGITEVPDPEPYDQRFYWGPDVPKDHAELVKQWSIATRNTAGTLLLPTDWMVVREMDNGTPVPDSYRNWRQSIRGASEAKTAAIEATTTTDELAAYITGADYPVWPLDPSTPAVGVPAGDGLGAAVNGQAG
jgi:hypothetical protein